MKKNFLFLITLSFFFETNNFYAKDFKLKKIFNLKSFAFFGFYYFFKKESEKKDRIIFSLKEEIKKLKNLIQKQEEIENFKQEEIEDPNISYLKIFDENRRLKEALIKKEKELKNYSKYVDKEANEILDYLNETDYEE